MHIQHIIHIIQHIIQNPDDIESGPLPVILPQQPAPAPAGGVHQ